MCTSFKRISSKCFIEKVRSGSSFGSDLEHSTALDAYCSNTSIHMSLMVQHERDVPLPTDQGFDANQFDNISRMVEPEFSVEDKSLELGIPTFYVKLREESKTAFLRLIVKLGKLKRFLF